MSEKEFFSNLKKGSNIILKNGLCGKFSHFENDKVVVEICTGVKLEFLKEVIHVGKSIELSKNCTEE